VSASEAFSLITIQKTAQEMIVKMKIVKVVCILSIATHTTMASLGAKEWKTVRLGTDATYAPFESVNPEGKIVGFEIDYAMALCNRMRIACTFQNRDWDSLIPALLTSKFDVIFSSMTITNERKKKVIFSDMYYAAPPVFAGDVGNKGSDISPTALKGKILGTQSSTTFANYLEKLYKDSKINLYPTFDEANLDLANGRIDYVLGDGVVEQNFIDARGNGCCRVIASVKRDPELLGLGVGAAFRPDDLDLRDMFNNAISELDADGTYKTLEKEYFKIDIRGQ
jgi:lysine-arginine-ornithine-binding protein